jgi:CDP-diacylglycerol--serine O-phosphatidyltransferase
MKNQIPNALTLVNLFCGCCGIVSCLYNEYYLVPVFMGLALLADYLDGFLARALDAKSDIGAQLDSLADMVTFGVLPGVMLFTMMFIDNRFASEMQYTFNRDMGNSEVLFPAQCLSAFIYTIFACIRLAKFNLDDTQTENFIGMPTPAGGMFVLGLYLNLFLVDFLMTPVYTSAFLLVITIVLSICMVFPLPMFSLKFNSFKWSGNEARILFLLMVIPQPFLFKWLSLSTIIMTYVGWSLLLWMRDRIGYNA